ncbi:helix-turn-helix domain-containing protein [Staphylococcus coagulans]|uniref:helix-turn-helix domain-containing protein n=1 Tax=Staphylococcus coagulans TaxID=74706 RepID=UPI002479B587|nr:helix-turn-helix transcriptional regulator [Staphylococcus coagulans]
MSKWEQGTIEPNIQMLNKLASFFNVSLDELVNGHEVEAKSDNGTSNVVEKPINGWTFLTQKGWLVLLIVIIVCGTLSQIFG